VSSGLQITVAPALDPADRAAVLAVADAAAAVDGLYPLDDRVLLDLEAPAADHHVHLVARTGDQTEGGAVAGYAHLDRRDAAVASAHVVVAPENRRAGVATSLVDRLSSLADGTEVRVWAHGDGEPARALAAKLGWERVRDLWQMRLAISTPIDEPSYPDDVTVRTFVPGLDEAAWVEVNAAAFEHHPEQGHLTVTDLQARERQPWFDSTGFFLAERDGAVVGSHWTKVHVDEDGVPEVGEVYVVGVSPVMQGTGLGTALTLTGLQYLRDRGLDVILYVDADNAAAVKVYRRIGFETEKVDVQYARPGSHPQLTLE
jgi:mycothiol synthase